MTNYAHIADRSAKLSTPFGEEIARKWFGDAVVDSMPKFSRGPRKGLYKGMVTWSKVERGGWVRGDRETANGEATGYVETRVGHVFNRKLCHTVSSQYGDQVGDVVVDLDYTIERIAYTEQHIKNYHRDISEYQQKIEKEISLLAELDQKEAEGAFTEEQRAGLPTIRKLLNNNIEDYKEDITATLELIAGAEQRLTELKSQLPEKETL